MCVAGGHAFFFCQVKAAHQQAVTKHHHDGTSPEEYAAAKAKLKEFLQYAGIPDKEDR